MKLIGRLLLVVGIVAMSGRSRGAETVTWDLRDACVVGQTVTNDAQRAAVEDLELHLGLVSGARPGKTGRFRFVVGRPEGEPEPARNDSFYEIRGDSVYFWGDDEGMKSRPHHGSLFAVSLFLEKELGVTWAWPGDDGIVAPRRTSVVLPAQKRAHYTPPLVKSEFRKFYKMRNAAKFNHLVPRELRADEAAIERGFADRTRWLLRHRLQDREDFWYGHAFTDWQPKYLKTHPDYLAMNADGTRGVKRGDPKYVKLCVSNPAVVDLIVGKWAKGGCPKYFNVCENDGHGYCQCPNCLALDVPAEGQPRLGHVTDRYVDFWNRLAAKAVALRPDVVLVAYAYANYRFPPRKLKLACPDNMLLGFVPSFLDDFEGDTAKWQAAGMRHFFLRPNFHCDWGVVPRGLERWLYDNFHRGLAFGMIGVDYDANLGRTSMTLESYVTARMIADPKGHFEDFCNDFYRAYGAAAPAVKRYYEAVRADGERSLALLGARRTNGNLLDDSQLSLQTAGRTEEGLTAQLTMLREALKDPALDATSRARLEDLAVRARHAVLGYRFLASASDPDRLEANGRRLLEFRKTAVKHLPDDYGALFSTHYGEEGPLWNRVGAYIGFLNGEEVPETGTMDGWRTDFEKAKLGTWGAREAFLAVTNDAASSGAWSVKLKTGASEQIGLWRLSNLLRPNASFRLSADVRLDPGVRYASLGVVLDKGKRPGEDRKWIASQRLKGPTDGFRRLSVDFRTPPEKRTVTFYFFVGPGGDGKPAWFDNAKLERLDETK